MIWLAVLEGVGERGICVHLTLHFCSIVHVAGFAMLVGIFYHLVFFFYLFMLLRRYGVFLCLVINECGRRRRGGRVVKSKAREAVVGAIAAVRIWNWLSFLRVIFEWSLPTESAIQTYHFNRTSLA